MKFQKNKDGFWETQYEGCTYILIGRKWEINMKYGKSIWLTNSTPHKRVFIIPTSKKTRKQAEADLKELLCKFKKDVNFNSYNETQCLISRAFRRAKLDEIECLTK